MATWGDWFKSAKEKGIPLEQYLKIDFEKDRQRLAASGLPVYESVNLDGAQQDLLECVRRFCKKHGKVWIRAINKKNGERFWKIELSCDDILELLRSKDLSDYFIFLYEYHDNRYGGNIVSSKEGVFIEVIPGPQWLVSKSGEKFFHGRVNDSGEIEFHENAPEDIRKQAKKVMRFIKISRNEYMQGYFEFVVSPEGSVYFLDYKLGF